MAAEVIPIRDWRDALLYTGKERKLAPCTANAITILRNDKAWVGLLAYDVLSQGIVCRRDAPWDPDDRPAPDPNDRSGAWRESNAIRLQAWLARHYALFITPKQAYESALVCAEGARFDPVRDYLEGLKWDDVQRVDRWTHTYLGAPDDPYHRLVGRMHLIGSVARGLRPGCKLDTMTVLEGPQGLRKSSGVEALYGSQWVSDTPLEMGSKDRFVGLRGVWCHEMAELDSFGKADATRVKTFLSSKVDDFRPPYAQTTVKVPRRAVMIGTVNPSALGYLRDETGNRRILPVRCGVVRDRLTAHGTIDTDAIERDRDQLWAEAVALYRIGARWWPETAEDRALCNEEQNERVSVDLWMGRIQRWLGIRAPGYRATIPEVLSDALGISDVTKHDRAAQTRVGMCLALAGWVQAGRRGSGARERYYGRAAEVEAELRGDADGGGTG
jgi:predicted P-loop ATPase